MNKMITFILVNMLCHVSSNETEVVTGNFTPLSTSIPAAAYINISEQLSPYTQSSNTSSTQNHSLPQDPTSTHAPPSQCYGVCDSSHAVIRCNVNSVTNISLHFDGHQVVPRNIITEPKYYEVSFVFRYGCGMFTSDRFTLHVNNSTSRNFNLINVTPYDGTLLIAAIFVTALVIPLVLSFLMYRYTR